MLLGDYDGLYDPTDFNDRLLLGLKGIMSEAELHFLRLRMHEGRLNKARRGELFNHAPIGYVREPGGGLALDPDEQAQQVVRMVFDQFDRQGSLHGLLRYLVHHSLRLPVRPHYGPNRGSWSGVVPIERHSKICYIIRSMPATTVTATALSTPVGRCPAGPGQGGQINQPENCLVLLENRCPAYIGGATLLGQPERRRPTAPAPRRLERCGQGPLCWEESSVAAVAGNG